MNSLTDFNEPKIVDFSNNGATFKTTESIKLTLYANGIALYNGPFRSFSQPLTKKFIIDIMDGYFPSELQSRYPDGVPIQCHDKRDTYFKQESNSVFQSKGYRLGSARIHQSNSNDELIKANQSSLLKEPSNLEDSSLINFKHIETQLTGKFLSNIWRFFYLVTIKAKFLFF